MEKNVCRFPVVLLTLMFLILSGCEKDLQLTKEEFILKSVEDISADSIKSYVQLLEGMGTRFFLAENHRQVAVRIKEKFISLGYPQTELDSFYLTYVYNGITYNSWQYNVIATLRGTDFPKNVTIIGAHYDNNLKTGDRFDFVPGANDNASGVAAMLEISRLLHNMSSKPKNSIKFVAFAAEESGLHGSLYYCDKARSENESIIMMLNNDMIAGQPDPADTQWHVNIVEYENSPGLINDAERICSSYTSLESYRENTLGNRSDSYAFQLYGYKPLFFTQVSTDENYHTINDTSSGCDFEYCREITKISYALLLEKNYWL